MAEGSSSWVTRPPKSCAVRPMRRGAVFRPRHNCRSALAAPRGIGHYALVNTRPRLLLAAMILMIPACSASTDHSSTAATSAVSTNTHTTERSSTTQPVVDVPSVSAAEVLDTAQARGWPRCQNTQLAATVTIQGAAAGNVGAKVILRNVSPQPCHLIG